MWIELSQLLVVMFGCIGIGIGIDRILSLVFTD